MRRTLHLQHRHHTGKLLAHKHTSYRGLFVLVALFGLAVMFIHQSVNADELIVNAKVAAPTPTEPAVIASSINHSTVESAQITITGTCEIVVPATVVEIYVDTVFAGSTACLSSHTFSIAIHLKKGVQHVVAKTVNVTNDYGPDSAPISITYTPPQTSSDQPTTPSAAPSSPSQPQATPDSHPTTDELQIHSKSTYLVYGPAKDAEWAGSFEGGSLPYKIVIDWGDGTSSIYQNTTRDAQLFRHHYTTYGAHFATVTLIDSTGAARQQQIAAVTPYVDETDKTGGLPISTIEQENHLLVYVTYGTAIVLLLLVVLMFIHGQPPRLAPQLITPNRASKRTRRNR